MQHREAAFWRQLSKQFFRYLMVSDLTESL